MWDKGGLIVAEDFYRNVPVSGHRAEKRPVAADERRLNADKIRPYQDRERILDMTSDADNRVLGRKGARTLSNEELLIVAGGTKVITHLPNGLADVLGDI